MNGDAAAEPVAARAPTSRVGRLMVLMVVLLSAVFGGIGWLQTQSLALLNANVVYQGDNIVWSFFQLETESLRLGQMLRDGLGHDQPGADHIGADAVLAPFGGDMARERVDAVLGHRIGDLPRRARQTFSSSAIASTNALESAAISASVTRGRSDGW